jgi:hypothetical protein
VSSVDRNARQYIIRPVRTLPCLVAVAALCATSAACGSGLDRQYEYEEEVYLSLDGSATVVVNASIPALVALRGLHLNPDSGARFDRAAVEAAYQGPGARLIRTSRPWRRHGRRFVQVRLDVDDIRRLDLVPPFAWSAYRFDRRGDVIEYRQTVGPSVDEPVGDVGWTGDELVAFRVHLPSRILFHNVRDLDRRTPGEVERGNILRWEQRLTDRLNGQPLEMVARIEAESILRATLWLFVLSGTAALAVLGGWIWWMVRKGRAGRSS